MGQLSVLMFGYAMFTTANFKNDFNADLRRENFLDKESIIFGKKVS